MSSHSVITIETTLNAHGMELSQKVTASRGVEQPMIPPNGMSAERDVQQKVMTF